VCEASNFEKPGAVIPHAGICKGQSGNWLFYLDDCIMTKSDSDTETQKNDGSIEKSIVIELIFSFLLITFSSIISDFNAAFFIVMGIFIAIWMVRRIFW